MQIFGCFFLSNCLGLRYPSAYAFTRTSRLTKSISHKSTFPPNEIQLLQKNIAFESICLNFVFKRRFGRKHYDPTKKNSALAPPACPCGHAGRPSSPKGLLSRNFPLYL